VHGEHAAEQKAEREYWEEVEARGRAQALPERRAQVLLLEGRYFKSGVGGVML